jgi:hypothetical protein
LGWTIGGINFVLTLALILIPLCGKKEQLLHVSGYADDRPANPVARIFKKTADDSPSPWVEGRDEGGRESKADWSRRNRMKAAGAHPQTGRTCLSAFRIPHL